jgi:hypothetical protein
MLSFENPPHGTPDRPALQAEIALRCNIESFCAQ